VPLGPVNLTPLVICRRWKKGCLSVTCFDFLFIPENMEGVATGGRGGTDINEREHNTTSRIGRWKEPQEKGIRCNGDD